MIREWLDSTVADSSSQEALTSRQHRETLFTVGDYRTDTDCKIKQSKANGSCPASYDRSAEFGSMKLSLLPLEFTMHQLYACFDSSTT